MTDWPEVAREWPQALDYSSAEVDGKDDGTCFGCHSLTRSKWTTTFLFYCAKAGWNGPAISVNKVPERLCARMGEDLWTPRRTFSRRR